MNHNIAQTTVPSAPLTNAEKEFLKQNIFKAFDTCVNPVAL